MAMEFLHELNVPFFKVGSGDNNNLPYLQKTAMKGERELILISGENVCSGRFSLSIWKEGMTSLTQNCLHPFYSLKVPSQL